MTVLPRRCRKRLLPTGSSTTSDTATPVSPAASTATSPATSSVAPTNRTCRSQLLNLRQVPEPCQVVRRLPSLCLLRHRIPLARLRLIPTKGPTGPAPRVSPTTPTSPTSPQRTAVSPEPQFSGPFADIQRRDAALDVPQAPNQRVEFIFRHDRGYALESVCGRPA